VATLLLAPGCRSWQSFKERTASMRNDLFGSAYEDPKASAKMADAEQLYAAGQYPKAIKLFRDIADNQMNPSDLSERARSMQAESRRMAGQWPEAVDTYHKLLQDFPTGAHRRESCIRMYEIADAWLDDFREELAKRSDEKGVLRWHPKWPNPFDRKRPF